MFVFGKFFVGEEFVALLVAALDLELFKQQLDASPNRGEIGPFFEAFRALVDFQKAMAETLLAEASIAACAHRPVLKQAVADATLDELLEKFKAFKTGVIKLS